MKRDLIDYQPVPAASGAITNHLLLRIPAEFSGSRAWRHNVGKAIPCDPFYAALRARDWSAMSRIRPVSFGLPGQPDIDGWLVIAPGLAVRLGVEVKAGNDTQTVEQRNVERLYNDAGCIYVLARDVDTGIQEIRTRLEEKQKWIVRP